VVGSGEGIMTLMTEYGRRDGSHNDNFVLHCIILLHVVVLVATNKWL
jgi:hypothetical protein